MAEDCDIVNINAAASTGDWTTSSFASPTLNSSASNTPIYIESTSCMDWQLKKGATGYTYETTTNQDISGNQLLVGWVNYPYADISAIPINTLNLECSSGSFHSTNYASWDALEQIQAPYNTPISGHTPVIGHSGSATESGTPDYSGMDLFGWYAVTGGTADGKQGGFDMIFSISKVWGHSETYTNTFFSQLYTMAKPATIPGTTSRPIGVYSGSGDFYNSNVSIQIAHSSSSTAATTVTETNKTVYFNNISSTHELGYIIDKHTSYAANLTLTNCVHFWNDQPSTAEIFLDPADLTDFKIDGCSFSNGGAVDSPPDTANRWIRTSKFDNCWTIVMTDGELTDCIVSNGGGITASGDADITGTSVLTPTVAADGSALTWAGNYDPDGNMDDMSFSKGTNAHHAIEFGTATPVSLTLRDIDFSGFNASNAQNDSTFYVRRTTGTVTINLIGVTGNTSYKTSGATVVVQATVTVTVTGLTEGAAVVVIADETVGSVTAGDVLLDDFADSSGEASFQHNYQGDLDVTVRCRSQGIVVAAIANDNGSLTDETEEANSFSTNDMTLLPTTPVIAQDKYHFGHHETFGGAKLDITTAAVGGGTITWSYWKTAVGYTALSGVTDGTSNFSNTGENYVTWTVPSDWETQTINSQGPFYYVKAEFSAGTITTAPKARKCTLDVTRYLPFVQANTISSTGLTVVASWIEDTIATF